METYERDYDSSYSWRIAEIIGAEPLRCWRNAALAVLLLPDLFRAGAYVEGWMVVPRQKHIALIEHGWSTMADQSIIDPTVVLTEKQSQSLFYFPGYVLSRDELCRVLSGSTLPLIRHSHYGDDGMKHGGYQEAYHHAWQQARELVKERHLPQGAIKVSGKDSRRGITFLVG